MHKNTQGIYTALSTGGIGASLFSSALTLARGLRVPFLRRLRAACLSVAEPLEQPFGGQQGGIPNLRHKEGPYQDRPLLCPFRLSPLLTYSGSALAFLKIQGPKSKNIENVILLQP